MIGVIATLTVQDGQQAAFEAAFSELVQAVRANEPGCSFYGLHKRSDTEYVVLERYVSQEALEAHGKSEHFRAAGPKLAPTLAAPPKVERIPGVI